MPAGSELMRRIDVEEDADRMRPCVIVCPGKGVREASQALVNNAGNRIDQISPERLRVGDE